MTSDGQLLRRYTESNSEDAFAELVRRHLDLVYSTALRQVNGDTHLAQDVAQSVFTDLARKAGSLADRQALAGWLYTGAHYGAAKVVRTEQRRHTHEQEAHAMQESLHDPGPNPDWETLRPVLDTAMQELNEADREVIVLRYFENRPHADIGEQFGLSENTARMRIERALEKLRTILARRGVTSTGAALAATLTAHSVAAAPVGLALTVTTTAVATAAGTAAGTGALTFLEFMVHYKTKLAVGAAVAAVVATPVVWQEKVLATTRAENRALTAQVEPLDSLRAEQSRLAQMPDAQVAVERTARERTELDRLRKEVPALREQLEQMRKIRITATGAQHSIRGGAGSPTGIISTANASDVGAATGEALLQTFVWAMRTANTNRLIQLCDWSAEGAGEQAEIMMREFMARRSMEPDAKDMRLRVLRQVTLEAGDGALVIEEVDGNGAAVPEHRDALRIRRAGNEWRIVMSENGPEHLGRNNESILRD